MNWRMSIALLLVILGGSVAALLIQRTQPAAASSPIEGSYGASSENLATLQARAARGDAAARERLWNHYRYGTRPGPESEKWMKSLAESGTAAMKLQYADYEAAQNRCNVAAEWSRRALAQANAGEPQSKEAAGQRVRMYAEGSGTLCPPFTAARTAVMRHLRSSKGAFSDVRRGYGDVVCGSANGRRFFFVNGVYLAMQGEGRAINGCNFEDAEKEYCEARPVKHWSCTGGDPAQSSWPKPERSQ